MRVRISAVRSNGLALLTCVRCVCQGHIGIRMRSFEVNGPILAHFERLKADASLGA